MAARLSKRAQDRIRLEVRRLAIVPEDKRTLENLAAYMTTAAANRTPALNRGRLAHFLAISPREAYLFARDGRLPRRALSVIEMIALKSACA